MRLLVLGATGFLGAHIVSALERDDQVSEVVGVARRVPADRPGWRELDLETAGPRALDALLTEVQPDVVVNAAGRTAGHAAQLHELNTAMVERLVAAVHRRVPDARLIHLGSAAEYGPAEEGHQTQETDEPRPVGPYGRTKLAATKIVRDAGFLGLDTVVLRVFNPVGASMDARTMPGNAARQLAAALDDGTPVIKLGSLAAYRDFVDAEDVASAVVASVHRRSAKGEVLNVAGGKAQLARAVVDGLVGASGYTGTVEEAQDGSERSASVSWQEADLTRTRRVLAWEPARSLDDSVQALWASVVAERSAGGPSSHPEPTMDLTTPAAVSGSAGPAATAEARSTSAAAPGFPGS